MTIRDLLTAANVGFQPDVITQIRLQRDSEEYFILLQDIYSEKAPELDVRSGDHIFVEDSSTKIVASSSVVDHRGRVVFDGVGEIKASGQHDELRSEIKKQCTKRLTNKTRFKFKLQIFSLKKPF